MIRYGRKDVKKQPRRKKSLILPIQLCAMKAGTICNMFVRAGR